MHMQIGQSFHDDSTPDGGQVMYLDKTRLDEFVAGSYVHFYVDLSTGALKAYAHPTTSPGVRVFIWIRATGQYANG